MIVTFSPIRMEEGLTASRNGSTLVLNGTAVDLAGYDAGKAPCPWIVGQPVKEDGVWRVNLILPHGGEAPEETLFPRPLVLETDGPLALPPHASPAEDSAGADGAGADGAG